MTKVVPQTPYVVICKDYDGPEPGRLRDEHAQAHFAHIESVLDKILVAGPLKNDAGDNIGSMLVFDVATEDEARELLARDPYGKVDIWESVEVYPFLTAAGDWIGGKVW